MREYVATAKTVEEAIQLGCEALSVDRDDLGVSYEILEMPQKTGFLGLKVTPAKVKVTVETADTEPETTPPAPVAAAEPEPAPAEEAAEQPAAEDAAPAEAETPLDIAADPRLQAALDYLTPIFHLMGVEEFTFTAGKKGEATILHVEGAHLGALIGRRGETMESLSYLASLVVNRMEGPYVKLGIDVGGYRNKREDDLTALAVRIANRVIRTGCYYEMEPMNPYERHIIHTAVAEIEGVRSESKGEGPDRRVVIYSTDPNASNLPDRDAPRAAAAAPTAAIAMAAALTATAAPATITAAAVVTAATAAVPRVITAVAAAMAAAAMAARPACRSANLPAPRVIPTPARRPRPAPRASMMGMILTCSARSNCKIQRKISI